MERKVNEKEWRHIWEYISAGLTQEQIVERMVAKHYDRTWAQNAVSAVLDDMMKAYGA